jgi:hypothetical protein
MQVLVLRPVVLLYLRVRALPIFARNNVLYYRPLIILYVYYVYYCLTTLSVSKPYSLNDSGKVGGTGIGRGKHSTRRKAAPVPLSPPQILHNVIWDRTRVAPMGSRRLSRLRYGTAFLSSFHTHRVCVCIYSTPL